MSYCVNCGVELEKSIKKCPMCNTPVINFNDLEKLKEIQSPYPESKGKVEIASKKDFVILLSIVLGCTALCCGCLNFFAFNSNKWSLIVAGLCALLWLISVPPLWVANLKKRIYVLYNGLMVCIFQILIGVVIDSMDWAFFLGIPITAITIFAIEILFSIAKIKRHFLPIAITILIEIALECVSIELLIENFADKSFKLGWSAIVLTVCCVLTITFITIVSSKKLRTQFRRRFHM